MIFEHVTDHFSGFTTRLLPGLPVLLLALWLPGAGARAESCNDVHAQHGSSVISVHCGATPSASFDAQGNLWISFVQDQHVYISHSEDLGNNWAPPVQVNAEPEEAEHNGEGRPKLLVTPAGYVLLSWTNQTSANYTGDIRFTRSTDRGLTFEAPRTINDDGLFTGHRFDELFLSESGKLYLTWLDKRDMEASLLRNETYAGAAVYYAVSEDFGATFSENHLVSANSCECCRIAMAPAGNDNVALFFRQIFDAHIRDHAVAALTPGGQVNDLNRATVDDWHIDACPHHGPAMVQAAEPGTYHLSWFSGGTLQSGIHYGRYDLQNGHASDIVQVDASPGAGHPHMAVYDDTLYLVWKGFTGTATELKLMTSHDNGRTWGEPRTLRTTAMASDHPLLVSSDAGVYLSWSTEEYGYLFEELRDAQ